jgi:hypothetical protein
MSEYETGKTADQLAELNRRVRFIGNLLIGAVALGASWFVGYVSVGIWGDHVAALIAFGTLTVVGLALAISWDRISN